MQKGLLHGTSKQHIMKFLATSACVSLGVFFNMDQQKEQKEERGGQAAVIGNYGSTSKSSHSVNTYKQTQAGKGMQGQKDRPVKIDLNISAFWSKYQRLMYIELKFPHKSYFLFKRLYNSSRKAVSQEFCLALFIH